MTENEIAKIVVDICYNIHTRLGPGLFESVYEEIIHYELLQRNITSEKQKPLPVYWNDIKLKIGFRADIIIENKVILEIKSIENLAAVHKKQVLTYLKISDCKLGMLINFNVDMVKDGIFRIVNKL
jgi:GxxExxY protein